MKEITIATYNILHGKEVNYDWSKLAETITESGADIIGLQEVDMLTRRVGGRNTLTGLASAQGFEYTLFVPAMDFDGGQYGTAILSRFPVSDARILPLPASGYEPRSFGCVTVTLEDGDILYFLNTHLSYESFDVQKEQISLIADWMSRHIPSDAPTVLTGDFNTENFQAFNPVLDNGFGLVNHTLCEHKTFRAPPMAIDNIVYSQEHLLPVEQGMIDSDHSDHNLLWCRMAFIKSQKV